MGIDSNKGVWRDIIEKTRLDPEVKARIKKTQLKQVEISPDGKHWNIVVESPIPFSATAVDLIEEGIRAGTDTKPKITFSCTYSDYSEPLSPSRLWNMTVTEVEKKYPSLGSWLQSASWTLSNNTLSITVASEVAVELIKTRKIDVFLREYWRQHGYDKIVLEIGWDQSLGLKMENKLTSEKDKELKKHLAQLSTPADQKPNRDQVLMGKPPIDEAQPISSLADFGSELVVEGCVTRWDIYRTRKGKALLAFDLADSNDAITVKTLLRTKEEELKVAAANVGSWLRVGGELTFDRRSGEEIIWARSLQLIEPKNRLDLAKQKRVELHLHTQMSSLDATTRLADLFSLVSKWGHKAVAITDHGSVQAFPEAYELSRHYGIKVIYGLEGYLVDDDEGDPLADKAPVYHIILLAKNQKGIKNLYRLVTLSHLDYFHRVPRIPRTVLKRYREGLILGSACEAGELFQALLCNSNKKKIEELATFYDFLEIQPRENNAFLVRAGRLSEEELLKLNQQIVTLGQELGKPVVATGDVHFLNPEDEILRRILLTGQKYSDAEFQPPLYFKTTTEMLEEFNYLGPETAYEVVVKSPNRIVDAIDDVRPLPAKLSVPQIPGAESQIETMAKERALELYGDPLPDLVSLRLEKELGSIIANGYAVIYLIAQRLVKRSLEDGYLVGSRGSVGSSLVATLCGITEVNPLPPHYLCPQCKYSDFFTDGTVGSGYDLEMKTCPQCGKVLMTDGHDIPFETFLGFKGDKIPDIDLNFSGEYQATIHRYTEELFGSDRVFRAGTISTIAERTAYGFVKAYADTQGLKLRQAQIDRLVAGLCGIRRTTGQHPGGVMIVPAEQDILDFTPIQYPADTKSHVRTTHFDYNAISDRLLKLDLLGHDDPTMLKMLEEMTGQDPRVVPITDEATMGLFSGVDPLGVTPEDIGSEVGTLGLPEFGTRFVRQMLLATRPQTFSELVRISGLSHGTDVWLNNAQELIKEGQATLSEVISTRDDIMLFLLQKGVEPASAFKIMESVRRGRGLNSQMKALLKDVDLPKWYLDSCQKIKYMFPKAHAVAYVMMAVRIGYFKVHHPAAFYASYFTQRLDDFELELAMAGQEQVVAQITELESKGNNAATAKERSSLIVLEVMREMLARGYEFAPLDIIHSDPARFQVTAKGLLPPLMSVPGLGKKAADNIVSARAEKPFSSQDDLRIRGRLSRPLMEALQKAGCLNHLPAEDQLSLF